MADRIRSTFGPATAAYTTGFHADPARLEEVVRLAEPRPGERVLDLATGAGNTAFALAPLTARVTGLDLTPEMLAEAGRQAAARGIANVDWVQGDACDLPFPDENFDLVVARAAPHHFTDLPAALRESRRVLRPGGRLCLVDCSPPVAARDPLHTVEVGRDPSHVLSRTLEEWLQLLAEAGFDVEMAERREIPDWDFDGWMANLRVPADRVSELAAVIEGATGEARDQLHPIRREGRLRHAYWHALIRARRPLDGRG